MRLEANQIIPHLWQGSYPKVKNLPPFGVTMLVLTALEHQDAESFPGVRVVKAPMDDTRVNVSIVRTATAAANLAAAELRRGGTVLVTCHMGVNRSGLVSALTLIELGWRPADAVAQVQRQRPLALSNPTFRDFLLSLEARRLAAL